MGGVLVTLLLTILICFTACKNNSSSEENEPEIIATYELNGDTIKLYDNNTFVITLKSDAGEISGTYLFKTSVYEFKVGKASGDIAKSGDVLKLKIMDGNVNVTFSDITRYPAKNDEEQSSGTPPVTGDDGEQSGSTPPTTSSGSQGNENSDMDYSFEAAPDESKKTDKFSIEENDEGIYLTFDVPKDTWQTRVYIDGIGKVTEQVWYNEDKTKGDFFFPFVEGGKEYAIRCVFLKDEDKDNDGFVIDYLDGDGTIAWFETKVKAGAKSKGMVRIKDFGKVKIENNGNFIFTERLTFENEHLLPKDWAIDMGLVEGVSWMHEGRKTKWNAGINIPQTELIQTHNLYTDSWKNGDFASIDFICYYPLLQYEYDGKNYSYKWDNKCVDTPVLKTSNIDISNTADVAKIKGTWIIEEEWDKGSFHNIDTQTLVINDTAVKQITSFAKTKLDGSAFTIDELIAKDWATYKKVDSEEEAEEFRNDPKFLELKKDSESSYKVYMLRDEYEISSDKKTVSEKYEYELKLSEIFAGHVGENYTTNYHFKLSEDGSILLIIASTKYSSGGASVETEVFKKQ